MIEEFVIEFLAMFAIFGILTLALNLQYGFMGFLNLGIYLQVIAGALTMGIFPRLAMEIFGVSPGLDFVYDNPQVVASLNQSLSTSPGVSILLLLITIIVAMVIAAFLGWLFTHFEFRLSGIYQVIFVIALAEIVRVIGMRYRPWAGGSIGVNLPDLFGWLGTYHYLGRFVFLLGVFGIVILVFIRFCNSPFGRLLKTIREDEPAAKCLGKDTDKTKRIAVTVASAFAGLVGVLFCLYYASIIPATFNGDDFAFWPLAMIIMGGTGSIGGALLGAAVFTFLRKAIFMLPTFLYFLPFDIKFFDIIFLGLILLLFILYKPKGILPEKFRPMRIHKR